MKDVKDSTKPASYSTCCDTQATVGQSVGSGLSRGARYNGGKPKLEFVLDFPNAIELVSEVAEYGAKKYSLHNWKHGLTYRTITGSLLRHLSAYMKGEETDEESGESHLGHIAWNALALAEMGVIRTDLDDRFYNVE